MILTGHEIQKQVTQGNIVINPFSSDQINPNSYNYRIGDEIIEFSYVNGVKLKRNLRMPPEGYLLRPHTIYLASTYEVLGSRKYAMSLIGRSSLGRLGLFLQVSANLGHTGSSHKWTLELVSTRPFVVYPNMKVGQISFWTNKGDLVLYHEGYSRFNLPTVSRLEI
jgi:dCTP deaminase